MGTVSGEVGVSTEGVVILMIRMKTSARCAVLCGLLCFFTSFIADGSQSEKRQVDSAHTQSQISRFWKWFASYETKFSKEKIQRDKFVSDVVDEIRGLSPNLTVEISPGDIDTMAISADGVESDFPLVQALVSKAPVLKGWKIVAFRQPGKIKGTILEFPEITLDPEKMWIYPIEKDSGFSLIVYFSDYTETKRNLFIKGSYILLDNAIGEYDVVKGIAALDFKKLPPEKDRRGILPFTELPKVFADYKARYLK